MHPHEPPAVAVSAHPESDPVHTVVWVRGDHDIATRPHLSRTLAQAARLDDADIIVDLGGVTFMDASTIGAIVDAHNRLRARSRLLSVRAPSTRARRLLDVCGLAFLIDEQLVPAHRPTAAALNSWVAVPVSDRASEPARPPAASREPARPTAAPRREPAESVQQGRTSS